MRQIKFIWDFRGPSALPTAKHHEIHLREFIALEALEGVSVETRPVDDMYAVVYLTAGEQYLSLIRDQLKPHRAVLA